MKGNDMSIKSIEDKIAGIAFAMSQPLDKEELLMLDAELDKLIALVVELMKVKR